MDPVLAGHIRTSQLLTKLMTMDPQKNKPWRLSRRSSQAGYSFIELLVVSTILIILASAILPLGKVTLQRQRESDLRRSMREMRTAIDRYKDSVDLGIIGNAAIQNQSEGYPPSLEILVEGLDVLNDASGRKLKFLRRIPDDPMTRSTDWGLRSYQDDPDSQTWGGGNVYDIYTKSNATALDGTRYSDW